MSEESGMAGHSVSGKSALHGRAAGAAKVLIVDDNEDYRRILRRTLEPAGYKIIEALSAEEAERLLAARVPDVALVDWMLPGKTGVEFCREARKDPRLSRMIVIMLSVQSQTEDQVRGLRESGANLYLTKPFSPPELLTRIAGLLQKRERMEGKA